MWLLSFLPDSFLLWIVNTILIAGIISFIATFFFINRLLRWFPTLAPYYLLLQIISTALLVGGIYFKGGYSVEQEWRDRVAALEAKIAIAEEKSKASNARIQTKIVTKTKVIHDTKIVIQEKLREVEKVINKECTVASEAIDIHNAAAKNVKPGEAK